MLKSNDIILVPWDFTPFAENSLYHAVQLAKVAGNSITLLHVVPKGGWFSGRKKNKEKIEEARIKLTSKAEDIYYVYEIKPEVIVREGNIHKTIKDVVSEIKANLIVMGPHYEIEHSKIDVINFIKLMSNSNVPFIITQEPPAHTHYVEIVVPIEYEKKYKETLRWIIYLAKYYKCNINFIKPYISDPYNKKLMDNNIYFTKKMLDSKNIVYGIKTAKRKKEFREEIFNFSTKIDADLILIMSKRYNRYVKDNKYRTSIPLMVINPRADLIKYQKFY